MKHRGIREQLEARVREDLAMCSVSERSIGAVIKDMKLTASDIKKYVYPFDNGGRMSPRMMLRLILKADKAYFDEILMTHEGHAISHEELIKCYCRIMRDRSYLFNEDEVVRIAAEELYSDYEYGEISALVNLTDHTIYTGAYALYEGAEDLLSICVSYKGRKPCELKFLKFRDLNELERVIRVFMLKMENTELTRNTGKYENCRVSAVRPPVSDWGMMIRGRSNG